MQLKSSSAAVQVIGALIQAFLEKSIWYGRGSTCVRLSCDTTLEH